MIGNFQILDVALPDYVQYKIPENSFLPPAAKDLMKILASYQASLPYWKVISCEMDPWSLIVNLGCPHGYQFQESLALSMLELPDFVQGASSNLWRSLVLNCMTEHVGMTPISIAMLDQHPAWAPVSYSTGPSIATTLEALVPALDLIVLCPACTIHPKSIMSTVIHLNDGHQWTREAIADWLDTLDIDLTIHPPTKKEKHDHDYYAEEILKAKYAHTVGPGGASPTISGGSGTN